MVSLKKNYLYSLAGQIVLFFVPLILVPYTSRTLGPENLGIYSYTFSIASIFSTFGRLGLNTYGKLQIAQSRDDGNISQIVWELMSLKLILTTIEIVLYTVFVFCVSEYRHVGMIMMLYLVADALDISWFYEGIEQYKLLAIRKFAVNILHLVLILMLVRGRDDLYIYALIMQVTVFLTNLTLWIGMRKHVSRPQFHFNARLLFHFRHCLVYFLPTIANLIYNMLDKAMLGLIGNSAVESGYYEQVYKIISTVQIIILQFGAVTLPRLTYLNVSNRSREFLSIVGRTQRLSLLLLLPMTVGLFLNAELIVTTVLGPNFSGCVGVMRILSVLMLIGALNYNIGNQILVSTERQREYNIGVFAGACVNFILNLLLIGRYYAIGAAIGSLVAEIVICGIFIVFSKKVVGIETLLPMSATKYILAVAIMAVCNVILKTYVSNLTALVQLMVIIATCATVYFIILLCLREQEMIRLMDSIRRKITQRI